MPELAVTVVVIRDNAVLLTKREDFEVWCLPGGAVDASEPLDQAARREVREETGIDISLTALIGICTKPFWGPGGTHSVVFAAIPRTDVFAPHPGEVTDLGYFPRQQLPEPLLWEHHHYIDAAFAGSSGFVWHNPAKTPPMFANRATLYRWRDALGVARQQAYFILQEQIGPQTMTLIVGKRPQHIIHDASRPNETS
jgi:ADP-ribose pyrophosphatase YjhB (NUDIX family)